LEEKGLMSWRALGAFVVFLAVAGGVYYLEVFRHRGAADEKTSHKLLDFRKEDAQTIQILTPKRQLRFVKRGENWFIEKPKESLASKEEVGYLLDSFLGMEKNDELKPSGGISPLSYGIGPDSPEVQITLDKDKAVRFWVGKRAPVEYAQYIALEKQNRIYLVNSVLDYTLEKSVDEYRERRLFPMETNLPVEATIHNGDDTLTLRKQGEQWVVESPKGLVYDETEVSMLGRTLEGLKRNGFIEEGHEDLKARVRAESHVAIETVSQEGSRRRILIGPKNQEVYLALIEPQEEVFRLTAYDVEALLKSPKDLQKKEVFAVSEKNLKEIRIVRHRDRGALLALSLIILRDKEGYSLFQGDKKLTPKVELALLVDNILSLRARGFLDTKAKELPEGYLNKPDFSVTLLTKDGFTVEATMKKVVVGKETKVYLKSSEREGICEIDPFLWDRLDRLTHTSS
jgi:hypothetical protein